MKRGQEKANGLKSGTDFKTDLDRQETRRSTYHGEVSRIWDLGWDLVLLEQMGVQMLVEKRAREK